ncbi:hypothetical protein Y032_0029g1972 [Ancylostoma ceylanicum]|uniref:Uncharacterized protein n=1 Tax=Ancylostoma ceylanicum TaxID=53326 RepID=A0A016URW6_9BILA|nr:hypothetical protein Y032_0029g1972 [Ancylostoma ceylanicum]
MRRLLPFLGVWKQYYPRFLGILCAIPVIVVSSACYVLPFHTFPHTCNITHIYNALRDYPVFQNSRRCWSV